MPNDRENFEHIRALLDEIRRRLDDIEHTARQMTTAGEAPHADERS
jgi:hypothetical protein